MTRLLTNKWIHIILLCGLLAAAVFFSGSPHELRQRLQYATFDTYNEFYPRPKDDRIAIIDLDEESLKQLGQWPFPRSVMAQMVERLNALGARVIAFDIVFAEPDRTSPDRVAQSLPGEYEGLKAELSALPNNDALFAQAIKEAGNVITGFTRARPEETLRKPYQAAKPTFLLSDSQPFYTQAFTAQGVATNLPEFSTNAAGNGSFMATPDIDGIIRQVSLFVNYNDELFPMLALEALRVNINPQARLVVKENKDKSLLDTNYIIKMADFSVPVEADSRFWVYYREIEREEYISAHRLFDESQSEELRQRLAGKIVFVGTSAEGLRDIRSTPLDIFVPGVEVHVNVVEQILQGKYLSRPNVIVGVEAVIIAVAGFLIIMLAPFINVFLLGVWTMVIMAWMAYGSWLSYKAGVLIDPVYPIVVLSLLFLVSSLLSYLRSEYERRRVRQAFGLYIAPSFMEELTKDPDKLKLGGEVKDLTILFSDIRRFTAISEHLSPEELIQLMNDFLTPMSDLVMQNRGTIDKYMGDAMMAFWNAPLDDVDHARHACLAALKMNEALIPINEKVKARAAKEGREAVLLNAGIGINSGPCSVGNMGSRQRFAYSALGDAVNLASRLEGQTKIYGVQILVGEDTQKQCADLAWLELDLLQVKGREAPVKISTLMGDENTAQDASFIDWQRKHLAFLAAYRAADFTCAAQDIKAAREAAADKLGAYYDMMAARIATYMKNPPAEDWDGVFIATEK